MSDKKKKENTAAGAAEATETTKTPEPEVPAEEKPETEPTAPVTETPDDSAAKLAAAEDRFLRLAAEYDNYRKRTTREKEEIGVVAKSKALTEILPVLDNFERAMQTECGDAEFRKGMELIFKSFVDALKKQGVEEIAAEGETFNPDLHYAVTTVEDDSFGPNTVAAVLQKGYRLGDKVLRHAMVSVANP